MIACVQQKAHLGEKDVWWVSHNTNALNLSSFFSSATKSLYDLRHITSSPSTPTSFPLKWECWLLSPLYSYSDSQVSVVAIASCHSSYIQLLTPLGPYISLGTDVVNPKCLYFCCSEKSGSKMYSLTAIHCLHLLLCISLGR